MTHARKTAQAALLILLTTAAAPLSAQDLMVNALPVDNKLRAIDSISIANLRLNESIADPTMPGLYPSWTHEYVHYDTPLPREYKIDLSSFHMPCDSRVVTSHFGYRPRFHRKHYGTDIKVYVGDTIRAAFDGKVRLVKYDGRGYGKFVMIRHANGLETLYGHMSKQLVKEDQIVRAGEPIGLGGSTGRSTGSHLHFETRFLGDYINPETLFSFEMHDTRANTYVYRPNGRGSLLNEHELAANNDEDEQDEVTATDKAEESKEFQAQRMQRQSRSQIYKVRKGDTLSSIAKKYHTTVNKLCRLNNLTTKSVLRLGQIIKCS